MISLIVPSYGAGPNIERTIQSAMVAGCDETIIISTALFDEDKEHFRRLTDKVIELPWNYVFLHGHGALHNAGTEIAKNDWLLLLGVAETVAESYCILRDRLSKAGLKEIFQCNHVNDPHTWKRVWNRRGGAQWSGIMHEEITGGTAGDVIFRMQDTDKTPRENKLQQQAFRYIKTLTYNWLYLQLARCPERLGAANAGWLSFVRGARESIEAFIEDHGPMVEACIAGDLQTFLSLVDASIKKGKTATGVNFDPQGTQSIAANEEVLST